jgi:hypothetical protein
LSVVCAECAETLEDAGGRVEAVRRNLRRTLDLRPRGVIVELRVQRVRAIRFRRRRLRAEWDRIPINPCHCAVHIPEILAFDFAVRLAEHANRAEVARYDAVP